MERLDKVERHTCRLLHIR